LYLTPVTKRKELPPKLTEYGDEHRIELKYFIPQMIRMWGQNPLRILWRTRRLQLGLIRSSSRRKRFLKKQNLLVPMGIGLSPTFRCNLMCDGCYARYHPRDGEMPHSVIQGVVGSAVEAGVFLFIITGGEPFMRHDMMDVYREHRSALFWIVTNGTLIDEETASRLAEYGNVFPIVSVEGGKEQTDRRRGRGVYRKVLECMGILCKSRVPFGFSAVLTKDSVEVLGSGHFVDVMIGAGCTVGVYNDFIPLDSDDYKSLPTATQKVQFTERLMELRTRKRILLLHLPHDEYDPNGRCMAVSGGGMHINARGWVEPCPFAHYARENIRDCSFQEVLRSPFLESIRSHPTVLKHGEIGCSLVNNRSTLEKIAKRSGARSTNIYTPYAREGLNLTCGR
jgi:MoaA/NifB/PqqE/SkfB family radical SAM enzyme